jgi:hypothetical protein
MSLMKTQLLDVIRLFAKQDENDVVWHDVSGSADEPHVSNRQLGHPHLAHH